MRTVEYIVQFLEDKIWIDYTRTKTKRAMRLYYADAISQYSKVRKRKRTTTIKEKVVK